jgi:hypothetical protein
VYFYEARHRSLANEHNDAECDGGTMKNGIAKINLICAVANLAFFTFGSHDKWSFIIGIACLIVGVLSWN